MMFDCKGRLFLAIDRMGRPATIVRGTFDCDRRLEAVEPVFTLGGGLVAGLFLDDRARICVVITINEIASSGSCVYKHSRQPGAALQFYSWTPAQKVHQYWATFTPYLRKTLMTVLLALSGSGARSTQLATLPPEICLIVLSAVAHSFDARAHIPGTEKALCWIKR
tara:strand:+ start:843 stop:1340 length:498 start_codon:yes stop_codon:yes gene_type:complete